MRPSYPAYYLEPFHAYSEGNLCWIAAFEAEPAAYSMAMRVWPADRLTADAAQQRLRESYTAGRCKLTHLNPLLKGTGFSS